MARSGTFRWCKGLVVSTVAALACCSVWASAKDWAQGVQAGSDAMFASFYQSLFAGFAGVVSMPLLLWAGMRATGERGNHLLVMGGTAAWLFLGGHVVEGDVGGTATAAFLALFAVVGSALSLVEVPGGDRRRDAR